MSAASVPRRARFNLHAAAALGAILGLLIALLAVTRGSAISPATPTISNIADFLEECPTNDPVYAQIRSDFEIRRNGIVVGAVTCTEPISAMPIADYTDEIIVLQGLRTIYYMEGGRTVPYPWTGGSLYDWMKSKIGGIDIAAGGSYCCESFNGRPFVVIAPEDDGNRDFDRQWRGISGNIDLYAHETRHVDGYPHVMGCVVPGFACDLNYDETDLSPYGIQWWLNARWLDGGINVGYGCLPAADVSDIANWHLTSANDQYRDRFVNTMPPLLTMPAQPGGPCPPVVTAPPTTAPPTTAAPTTEPPITEPPTTPPTVSPTHSPTPTATHTRTPSPTATKSPTPTPTAASLSRIWGDVDCSGGDPDAVDALKDLRHVAGLPVDVGSCPAIGGGPLPAAAALIWGDWDCDGDVTSVDALQILRSVAHLTTHQEPGCPAIGQLVLLS